MEQATGPTAVDSGEREQRGTAPDTNRSACALKAWPVLDFTGKLHDLEGNLALYRYLAGLFNEVTPEQLANLFQALSCEDPVSAERAAHKLKGSVLVLGGLRLGHTLDALESQAELGRLDDAAGWRRRVSAEYEELKTALEEIRWDELANR